MPLKSKKQLLLSKIEATYGVDPVPTAAANAMLVENLKFTPANVSAEDRNHALPWFGSKGKIIDAVYGTLEFDVPIIGSGAAGTAPYWGVHMRGSAMSETISAGVSVAYAPISSGEQSVAHYYMRDGTQYKLLGARAKKTLKFSAGQVPMYHFSYTGLRVAQTDVALSAPTLPTVKPLPVTQANTTFTLHTIAAVLQELNIDFGEEVKYTNRPNAEYVSYGGRKITGSCIVEKSLVATKDWDATLRAGTTGAFASAHGTTAGNRHSLASNIVQVTSYEESDADGIVMCNLGLEFLPGAAGSDDLIITLT